MTKANVVASTNNDAAPTKHQQGIDLLDPLYTMKPAELRSRWREVYRSVAPDIGPDGRPMSPVCGQKGSKLYCYNVTRFKAGADRSSICRIPAGALDRIVIDSFASYLRKPVQTDASTCKVEWQTNNLAETALADSLHSISTSELRALLIDHNVRVHIADDCIEVKINKDQATITIAAQLVRRGNELRIALPPDGASTNTKNTDPALVRLVIQGFAAREHLLSGEEIPTIADYDKRHLHRLARISWLAPDIITAILDGRQPLQLTARHLLRCANIPLEWQQQRHFLRFS